jgi:hypothetical protein
MMTFLNPFVLFGLAAAAIPILIHLFNVRKLRTIEFSTLTFLKELNKNKIRRIKVRQWLLLALRTLLIILIVLAFSRPALQGTFGSASSRASSTIIILMDNTASMELHNEQGTYLSQVQQKAREIATSMQENDEAYLLRLSDLPLATTEEPLRDPAALLSLIDATTVGQRHRTIEEGLRVSSRLLQQSRNFNKEIYILTDGQATSLATAQEQQRSAEQLFPPNVRLFMLAAAREPGENVAVERMEIPPTLLQPGKPFTVNVTVKNHGTSPVTNHVITMKIGSSAVMQKGLSLDAGEQSTLEFLLTAPRAGFLPLTAESEDDAFEADNRLYGSVLIPEQIAAAVVASSPDASRFIVTALNTAASSSPGSPVTITTVAPSQLSASVLAKYDVVILSGVAELSGTLTADISAYLASGGSLLFFPSADSSSTAYPYLTAAGVPALSMVSGSARVENVDLQFPIFRGMFEKGLNGKEQTPESPSVRRAIAPKASGTLRSIATLSNGLPFLWQKESGRGRIIGFAVPATTDWSDLPMKGLFVPLLFQTLLYCASPVSVADASAWSVGEPLEFSSALLPRRNASSAGALRFFDAEQRGVPATSYTRSGTKSTPAIIYTIERTEGPGHYTVLAAKDTASLLPVNVRREESSGTLTSQKDVDALLGRLGIPSDSFIALTPESDILSTITESRFGIELWRYFLLAALLVALAEMAVAREAKQYAATGQQRSGGKNL